MDTEKSPTWRIIRTLTILINLYTVYCFQSHHSKTDKVLTNNVLNQTISDNKRQEYLRQDTDIEVLTIMGLQQRRNLTKINAVENSASSYMFELYKMINDDNGHEGSVLASRVTLAFSNTSVPDRHEINGASLIMSFRNHAYKLQSLQHQRKSILYFDFTDVLPGLIATHAEVQLYKERTTMQEISIYLLETFLIRRGTNKEEKILHPVANLTVSKSYEGWLSMKVTDAANYWTANREENLGLYLRITDVEIGQYIDPDKCGVVGEDGPKSKRIFMISYFKKANDYHVRYTRLARQVPNTSPTNDSTEGDFNADFLQDYKAGQPSAGLFNPNQACKRHEMYVNFTELGWNSWIMHPLGYQAYYCAGECRFPLVDHLNATVHAVLQTIVHDTNPGNIPKVCCVPTELGGISILHQPRETVVVENLENMVVKACGCR